MCQCANVLVYISDLSALVVKNILKNFLIIFLLAALPGFSQKGYKLIATIKTEGGFFTSDNQSNIYLVKNDELIKYNKEGKELYRYSNKNLGNITYVDAS